LFVVAGVIELAIDGIENLKFQKRNYSNVPFFSDIRNIIARHTPKESDIR